MPFLRCIRPRASLEAPRPALQYRPRRADRAARSSACSPETGSAPPRHRRPTATLVEPLSESELRVLRYLPTNLTGPEIAAELYVSHNTVKTHVRNLYAKIGTHRRAEAVARARELGLLAPSAR